MDKNVDDTKLENNTTPETEDQENAQTNPEQQEEKKEDKRLQNTIKNLTILFLILVILILLLRSCACGPGAPVEPVPQQQTAVLAEKPVPVENDPNSSGLVSVNINPYVLVKHKTMQNLQMSNENENRYMSLIIKSEDGQNILYESPLIAPGEKIIGDVIDMTHLTPDTTMNVLGEIYFYTMEKTPTSQTNVKMKLIVDANQEIPQ